MTVGHPRPIIAITMGDPAGIGPEIIAKAMVDLRETRDKKLLIIGDCRILERGAEVCGVSHVFRKFDSLNSLTFGDKFISVLEIQNLKEISYNPGNTNAECGEHSYQYVSKAVELAMLKQVQAIVTCPISKQAWHLADRKYNGHTELLADLTASGEIRMMFLADALNVILVTTHIPLSSISKHLTQEGIYKTIIMGHETMLKMGVATPRIAVCGLNPHAGETGIFGSEEIDLISPAIQTAKNNGVHVNGPYPADTAFVPSFLKQFDLIVAQYHDQGLIPVKMVAFDHAVNVTVGLPIIRTSVDHGTAFNISGKGIANHQNLIKAVDMAARLAGN